MRSLAESLHFAQPATGTVVDTVDLEQGSRMGVDSDRPDATEREPSPDEGGNSMKG